MPRLHFSTLVGASLGQPFAAMVASQLASLKRVNLNGRLKGKMMSRYIRYDIKSVLWNALKTNESKKHLAWKEFGQKFTCTSCFRLGVSGPNLSPGTGLFTFRSCLELHNWSRKVLLKENPTMIIRDRSDITARALSSCCLGLWFAFGTVRTTRTTSAESTIIQAQSHCSRSNARICIWRVGSGYHWVRHTAIKVCQSRKIL